MASLDTQACQVQQLTGGLLASGLPRALWALPSIHSRHQSTCGRGGCLAFPGPGFLWAGVPSASPSDALSDSPRITDASETSEPLVPT